MTRALLILSLTGLLGAAGPVARCDSTGRDICDLDRPEDVTLIPRTDWLAVSTASFEAPLVFIDTASKRRAQLSVPVLPWKTTKEQKRTPNPVADNCTGAPSRLRAGGNDVRRVGGELRLALINHPDPGSDGDRVELFVITLVAGTPTAHWIGCVAVPVPYALNDVALGPDGELYASHQFERPRTADEATTLQQKFLSAAATGYAIEWTEAAGWTRLPDTDLSFATGIAVSTDGHRIAVAGTYDQTVLWVDRSSGAVRRLAVPLQPYNLTALADGSFLVVGHTGVPVTGVDACRDPSAIPCGFPFAVALIDRKGAVKVLLQHDGSHIPGASVAVLHGHGLYLGSAFGDRVTVLDPPPGSPHD